MKEKKFSFIYFFIFSVLLYFTIPNVYCENGYKSSPNAAEVEYGFNNSLVIAERDILSFYLTPNINTTANLTLIIYHEAWIINYDNVSKCINISNPIPREKYKKVFIYPVIGKKAIIQQSMIPNYFNPKNATILNNPIIQESHNYINYTWNEINIDPMEAVIITYANFYDDGSKIYDMNNIYLPDIKITRSYNNYDSLFLMNYSVENIGKLRLGAPGLVLFFPEKIDGTQLIIVSNLSINSSNGMDIFENTTYNDGTGKFSNGHMVLSNGPEYIDTNRQLNYSINVKGIVVNTGKIIPSLIINYKADSDLYNRSGQMARIWPATEILSREESNVTRFYYYEVSLVIPENNYFYVKSNKSLSYIPPEVTKYTIILMIILIIILITYSIAKRKR